jgi:gliding motility-associated-like protein
MFTRFLPISTLILFCATATSLWAQVPETYKFSERSLTTPRSAVCRGIAFAGSTQRRLANTNKNTSDIRFLCLGDSLYLTPSGSANLFEDPIQTTQAGIGYLFYNCPPRTSGPTSADVKNDPCWTRNPATNFPVVTRGDITGQHVFHNSGALQTTFAGGRPVKFYFAPATFYDFNSPTQDYFENDTACVHVNIRDGLPSDTFSVVYLNAVRISNVSTSGSTGSFVVSGGLPEYDNRTSYVFTITLRSNPAIRGTVTTTGNPGSGSRVTFSVPQHGLYDISVRDGKSCDAMNTATFAPCVTLKVSQEIAQNNENVCVKITADSFVNIASMQTFYEYDTTQLEFIGLRNSTIANLDNNNINRVPRRNMLILSWGDGINGVTKPNGATLFELCFRAIGRNGTTTTVGIKDTVGNEMSNPAGTGLGTCRVNGQVKIGQLVTVTVPCVEGSPNETICLPIRVNGFTNIASVQLYFVFDPTVMTFVAPARNVNLPPDFSAVNSPVQPRIVAVSWNPPTGSVTRPDSAVIFELCFRITGAVGSSSTVRIVDTLGSLSEISDATLRAVNLRRENCTVNVVNNDFTIKTTGTNALCNGNRARFEFTPTGVGAPFTYTWASATNPSATGTGTITNVGDTIRIGNLAIGKYYVTVVNSAGTKTRIDSVTLTQPNPLFLNPPQFVNPSCFDSQDGSLTLINFGGGTPRYSFRWSTGDTTTAIMGLAAGAYGVTMTDMNGCKDSIPRFTIGVNEIMISNTNVIDATCTGVNTGSISIGSVIGGTPTATGNYTFIWSNGQTTVGSTATQTNLAPGNYTLTVSDSRSCRKILNFTVGASRVLGATSTVGNISCFGLQNGFINAVATATGTEARPYVFTWTGAVGTPTNTPSSTTISRLAAGTYPLSIRDNSGCRLDTVFSIRQPDSIKLTVVDLKNESCIGGPNNGSISLSVSGGTPISTGLYNYRWNRGNSDTLPIIGGLSAGTYSVTVTDGSNCTKTQTFTITPPVFPTLDSIRVRAATCSDRNDGFARIFVKAGTGLRIDSIRWSNTGFLDSITAVVPGTYTVRVFSSNGCQRLDTVRIPSPTPLSINRARSSKTDPVCPKDATGTIIIVMQGGTAPYSYQWSGGPNTSNSVFASLSAGTYRFSITDANGCTPVVDSVTIVDPPSIKVIYSDIDPVTCYGKCNPGDGKATVTASGGTANTGTYTFTWSTGESCNAGNSCISTLLCGGYQKVTVTDNICGIVDSVFIPAPDSFSFDQPLVNQPSCNGDRDGSIEVKIKGGNPPYNYFWNNGTTQNRLINIGAGNYSAIITDAKLCSYTINVEMNQPDSMQIDTIADGSNNVTCYNLTDGQIKLKRLGGNGGPTTWRWSNGNTTDSLANLKAGVYTITATDVKNCTAVQSFNLTQPDQIYFFMQPPTPPKCNGDLTTIRVDTAFGSTYRYNFTVSIDNGPQYPIGYFVPVFAGPHQLQIVEQVTGCLLDTTIQVNEPPAIKIGFDPAPSPNQLTKYLVGLGDSLRLTPNVTTSLPLDSVIWTPKTYLTFRNDPLRPFVKPLDDVQYKVKVYDVNGCTAEIEVLVELDRNRNLFVPNIFSPNGDDQNDFFGVYSGAGVKSINYVRIYDRWGELLFSKQNLIPNNNSSQGWDGTYNGRPVSNGVYVYMIEVAFEDGQVLLYRGDVTLIR